MLFPAILTFLGLCLIAYLLWGLRMIRDWNRPEETDEDGAAVKWIRFSVLVPARNEEKYLPACLESLGAQHFPADRYEVIVIDDFSDDRTAEIAESYTVLGVRTIRLSYLKMPENLRAHKKWGLTTAIGMSSFEYVVTADADCIYSPDWLQRIEREVRKTDPDLLLGPVRIRRPLAFLDWFQQIDMLAISMISWWGARSGWFYSGSAANMMVRKEAFYRVDGYEGNLDIASGDDIFLIEKFRKAGLKIRFTRDPANYAETAAEPTIGTFLRQRLRWAGKTRRYPFSPLGILWIFTGGCYLLFAIALIGSLLVWNAQALLWLLVIWILKSGMDYALVRTYAASWSFRIPVLSFLLTALLHPIYVLVVGIGSQVAGRNRWK